MKKFIIVLFCLLLFTGCTSSKSGLSLEDESNDIFNSGLAFFDSSNYEASSIKFNEYLTFIEDNPNGEYYSFREEQSKLFIEICNDLYKLLGEKSIEEVVDKKVLKDIYDYLDTVSYEKFNDENVRILNKISEVEEQDFKLYEKLLIEELKKGNYDDYGISKDRACYDFLQDITHGSSYSSRELYKVEKKSLQEWYYLNCYSNSMTYNESSQKFVMGYIDPKFNFSDKELGDLIKQRGIKLFGSLEEWQMEYDRYGVINFCNDEDYDYEVNRVIMGIEQEKQEAEADKEAKSKVPTVGMTKKEVEKSKWGKPDRINVDEYAWGTSEQWCYDGRGYVYFTDDIVTSVQKSY